MTDYITNDTELTTVADAIRQRGGTSAPLEYPDEWASAILAIPSGGGGSVTQDQDGYIVLPPDGGGGGGSDYELINSQSFTYSTTSTSAGLATTLYFDDPNYVAGATDYQYVVYIIDSEGRRTGYFNGSISYFMPPDSGADNLNMCVFTFSDISGTLSKRAFIGSGAYGLWAYQATMNASTNRCTLTIRRRYSSSITGTINSTYDVSVYRLALKHDLSL